MLRFLVVEDNSSVRHMVINSLRRRYTEDRFDSAADFFEAVRIFAAAKSEGCPVNGCLSDFNYSGAANEEAVKKGHPNDAGQGGLDLLEHVKGNPQTGLNGNYPGTSFAFMSGNGFSIKAAIEERGLTIGDDHILEKPFRTFQALFNIIDLLKVEAETGNGAGAIKPNQPPRPQPRAPAI